MRQNVVRVPRKPILFRSDLLSEKESAMSKTVNPQQKANKSQVSYFEVPRPLRGPWKPTHFICI